MAAESASIPKPSSVPFSQFIDGLQFPGMFSADCVRSAIGYSPRPEDIILATYPKCGTTWAQQVLALVLRHGEPFDQIKIHSFSPFLEMFGGEAAAEMPRPGVIKVHLPFHLAPWSDKAKYIYIARNPMDCCVSYFHHMKNTPGYAFNGTFDEFFELFLSGKIDYGDYFDHLLGWYAHRNDPNVLFMTYEEMKEDTVASVLKMASFVDDKLYAEPLRTDPKKLQNVITYSSFNHMKEAVNNSMDQLFSMGEDDIKKCQLPRGLEEFLLKAQEGGEEQSHPKSEFMRKGIVGDWKNHFTDEQYKRLKAKFEEKTRGTDIPKLFEKCMI